MNPLRKKRLLIILAILAGVAIAVALGFLPSIAYLLNIKFGNPAWIAPDTFAALYNGTDGHGLPDLATIVAASGLWLILRRRIGRQSGASM